MLQLLLLLIFFLYSDFEQNIQRFNLSLPVSPDFFLNLINNFSSDSKIEIDKKIDHNNNFLKRKFIFTIENLKKLLLLYGLPDLSSKKFIILNFSPKFDHYHQICFLFKIKLGKRYTLAFILHHEDEESKYINLIYKIFGAENQ